MKKSEHADIVRRFSLIQSRFGIAPDALQFGVFLANAYNITLPVAARRIAKTVEEGYLSFKGERIGLTLKGRDLIEEVLPIEA